MTRKFLTSIDLLKNQIKQAAADNVSSDPGSPVEGQFWQNTTGHVFKWYNGTSVIDPLDRTNHTNTQLASTISNFDTQVRTSTLNQMTAPTADLSINTHKLTNVVDPTNAQEAATKNYVDGVLTGSQYYRWKTPVRLAATSNIALTGAVTVDGVAVVTGDRVLVTAQTTGSQNGIYVAHTGTAWTRSEDANGAVSFAQPGLAGTNQVQPIAVEVTSGSSLAGSLWYSVTTSVLIGTTTVVFTKIDPVVNSSGSGAIIGTLSQLAIQSNVITNTHINSAAGIVNSKLSVTTDFDINTHKLINVVDPTNPQDAATKNYVDTAVAGLAWKDSVRAATTVTGTLATAFANGQVIDTVTLVTGNRILLKNQTAPAENGIYVVAASGAPARAADAATGAALESAAVFVEEGTANVGTAWVMTTDNVVIGTTGMNWAQFAGTALYTASNGVLLTGANFTAVADPTPATIIVGSGGISVDTSAANNKIVRKFAQDNSSGTTTTVTHSFGTRDVQVQCYDLTTFETIEADVVRTSTSVVTVTTAASQTASAFRILIQA